MLRKFEQGSRRWFAAKIALTMMFVVLGLAYLALRWEEFSNLHWPSAFALAAVSSAFVCNLWLGSWFNVVAARKLGADISGLDSFAISSVTSAINFVLPLRAGAGMRAIYMKRKYQLSYSYFASTLAVFSLANLLIAAIVAMACVIIVYRDTSVFKADLFLLFPSLLITAGVFLIWRRLLQPTGERQRLSPWQNVSVGVRRILSDRLTTSHALLTVFLSIAVSTFGWTVALRDYAPDISIAEAILIVVSQVIGGLILLTAGGTGFQELAGIYVGHRLGITTVELFAVLVWTKAVRILVSFALALPSAMLLRKQFKSATEQIG